MTRLLRLMLILPIALLVLNACGSDDADTDGASPQDGPTSKGTPGSGGDGACTYRKSPEKATKAAEVPPSEPKKAGTMTITTNRGSIKAKLDAEAAPCAVNSFVSLAEQGYFNDTKCHRLVPGFVLQCGDPTATGAGGPGYSFADELTGDETYTAGTLAMANSGPDTNGSQFFIVLAEADLDPAYTVFGQVDAAGLKVAKAIERDGNKAGSESPAKDVVIKTVK